MQTGDQFDTDEERAAKSNRFYDHEKAFKGLIEKNKEINLKLKETKPLPEGVHREPLMEASFEMFEKAYHREAKVFKP